MHGMPQGWYVEFATQLYLPGAVARSTQTPRLHCQPKTSLATREHPAYKPPLTSWNTPLHPTSTFWRLYLTHHLLIGLLCVFKTGVPFWSSLYKTIISYNYHRRFEQRLTHILIFTSLWLSQTWSVIESFWNERRPLQRPFGFEQIPLFFISDKHADLFLLTNRCGTVNLSLVIMPIIPALTGVSKLQERLLVVLTGELIVEAEKWLGGRKRSAVDVKCADIPGAGSAHCRLIALIYSVEFSTSYYGRKLL